MKIIALLIILFVSAVHAQFRDGLPDSTQGFFRVEKKNGSAWVLPAQYLASGIGYAAPFFLFQGKENVIYGERPWNAKQFAGIMASPFIAGITTTLASQYLLNKEGSGWGAIVGGGLVGLMLSSATYYAAKSSGSPPLIFLSLSVPSMFFPVLFYNYEYE